MELCNADILFVLPLVSTDKQAQTFEDICLCASRISVPRALNNANEGPVQLIVVHQQIFAPQRTDRNNGVLG